MKSDAKNETKKKMCRGLKMVPTLVAAALIALGMLLMVQVAQAQSSAQTSSAQSSSAQTFAQTSSPSTAQNSDTASKPPAHDPSTLGGELAKETRESTGEDEEENADLKHSTSVQKLGQKLGLSVHQAHMAALSFNFAVVLLVTVWACWKFLPAVFRNRTASIQKALEEARTASAEANSRLADIEKRLSQLDAEIAQMTAHAEKEAAAEEVRIQKAAEEDVRKVVLAAEQEIAAATKQARRELSSHTANLAIALATKQIKVDSNTDQVLVRSFASTLASENDKNGGKGGR